MSFGLIDPISGGTINSCTPSGPKIISNDCTNASFVVYGEDSSGANATTFKVFITDADSNLSNAGNTAPISFSLDPNSVVTSKTYDFPAGVGSKNINVFVYGNLTLGNVASQVSGSYNGNYTVTACSCSSSGCPETIAGEGC